MEAKIIAALNDIFSSVDPNWQPTDSVPQLAIEAFKELYPLIVAVINGVKAAP